MKKLTKQQLKNRKILAESLTQPLKSKEQIEKDHQEFQKRFKKRFG